MAQVRHLLGCCSLLVAVLLALALPYLSSPPHDAGVSSSASSSSAQVTATQVLGARTFTVRVADWGSPRTVAVHENDVYLQAATCYPCPICDGRVQQLEAGIKRSGMGAGVETRQMEQLLFFVVPLPDALHADPTPQAVVAHLSKLFDHPIRLLTDTSGTPIVLPMKREIFTPIDAADITWDVEHVTGNGLTASNEAKTIEWVEDFSASWVPAKTTGRLGSGKFHIEFRIDDIANGQIGVGFMLMPPNWGFFGYLGASTTAWSYDAFEGAIVTGTEAIHSGLPKIASQGVVALELTLIKDQPHKAQFIIDGEATPEIDLPDGIVVMPAACLLRKGQKVTLQNFSKGQ